MSSSNAFSLNQNEVIIELSREITQSFILHFWFEIEHDIFRDIISIAPHWQLQSRN